MSVVKSLPPICAVLASLIPLAFTIETLDKRLTPAQMRIVRHPLMILALAFGTGYAACGNVNSTAAAVTIVIVFLSVYEDMFTTTKSSSVDDTEE